ncbi:hypothetical protein N836_00445 [Leptolyngbya sp. Heron Island J]|nr:hypothetical protein N836_00445 [Leptolyngbya sp. Heron Island J]
MKIFQIVLKTLIYIVSAMIGQWVALISRQIHTWGNDCERVHHVVTRLP